MALGVSRKDLFMVAVLLSGALLAVLNLTLLSPALPSIMNSTGVSSTTAQWLTSGYALVEAVVIPLSPFLIGKLRTRKLFLLGLTIFATGSLVATFAPNFWFLLLGRMLQATCTGMVMPMVFTVVLLVFPREKRGTAMGMISLIIGFAPAIGPSLSGVLVDSLGWRALFALSAVLSVVVIILAATSLKDYGKFKKTTFDLPSTILSTVGLVCLLYGLSTFASSSNLVITLAMIVLGAVLVATYARRQLKLEQPMLEIRILKTRNYACAVCVMILVQAAMMGTEVITPIYIQSVRGLSATMSGLAMLPGAVIGAFVGMIAGRLFDRFGVRKVALPGACVALCGGIALSMLGMDTRFIVIALSYTILIVGLQFTMTPINTWGVNSLDNGVIQHAQGLSNTMNQVAGSLGTAILVSISALSTTVAPNAGALEQLYIGEHMAFTATAIMICVAVCVIAVLVKNKKQAAAPSTTPAENSEGASSATEENVLRDAYSVGDIMKRQPAFAYSTMNMDDVIRLMAAADTSGLPIVDAENNLCGFISDGDIAKYIGKNEISIFDRNFSTYKITDDDSLAEKLQGLFELNVMNIATKRVVAVEASESMDDACRLLAERRIKKMPVVSEGKLVGTLSRRDVVTNLARMLNHQD